MSVLYGECRPLLLCTRFRGNMDVWDPTFLDGLADEGFRVITFDYRVHRDGELIAHGFTRHVWVDANNRPRRLPDDVLEAIAPFIAPAH